MRYTLERGLKAGYGQAMWVIYVRFSFCFLMSGGHDYWGRAEDGISDLQYGEHGIVKHSNDFISTAHKDSKGCIASTCLNPLPTVSSWSSLVDKLCPGGVKWGSVSGIKAFMTWGRASSFSKEPLGLTDQMSWQADFILAPHYSQAMTHSSYLAKHKTGRIRSLCPPHAKPYVFRGGFLLFFVPCTLICTKAGELKSQWLVLPEQTDWSFFTAHHKIRST